MSRSFFHKNRAEEFAEFVKHQGYEMVEISAGRDAFNQTLYRVKWN
jgi:hypothetical protein